MVVTHYRGSCLRTGTPIFNLNYFCILKTKSEQKGVKTEKTVSIVLYNIVIKIVHLNYRKSHKFGSTKNKEISF